MCVKYDVIEWKIFYEMVSSVANKLRPHMHYIPNVLSATSPGLFLTSIIRVIDEY